MYYFSNTNEVLKKSGNYSEEVKNLQRDLTTLGYSTNGIDGYFGNNTYSAVLRLQKDYGLTQDGMAGRQTLSKINDLIYKAKNGNVQSNQNDNRSDTLIISGNLSIGMKGTSVSNLQSALTKLGYNTYGIKEGIAYYNRLN